jgi:hypothetical protein
MTIYDAFRMRPLLRSEIESAVADADWQVFRSSLHFVPIPERLRLLKDWVDAALDEDRDRRHVQTTNYINALARGGMVRTDCEYVEIA